MKRTNEPWAFLGDYRGSHFTGEWPTLPEMFRISASRHPDRRCFTTYDPEFATLTYAEALEKIERLARFIVDKGVAPDAKVAVTGKNGPEWAVAYMAALFAGAAVVPIDYQLHEDEIENLIRASDAEMLFCDAEKFDELTRRCASRLPKGIYSLDPSKPLYAYSLGGDGASTALPARNEEDLAAILFTSGTTGIPKGVMLSHRNFVSDCYLAQGNLPIYHDDVFYALLPIHHSYTMLAVFIEAMSVGAEVVFGKKLVTKQILSDLREAKVTMFLGVPMLFNKVLNGIMKGIRDKGPVVYGLIRFLMAVSGCIKAVFRVNPGKKIFKTVLSKASLATNRICISGGGPLAPGVFKMYNQLGIDFVQGYGLTETAPILTLNPTDHFKIRSVGKILPRVELKILDPDALGRGEIAARGPMVMRGYYRNPEATAEVFTEDGWFKTGDVGYLDSEQYLYLTGRAKNMIVTEGGKNVYPEEIENEFQLFGEIEQILVRGFVADKKRLIEEIEALVYPNKDALQSALGEASGDAEAVKKLVDGIVAQVNARLLPYQKIARVTVLAEPMEMTTTKKIKRNA
jgi:long-chain acyl-CoA synthetase